MVERPLAEPHVSRDRDCNRAGDDHAGLECTRREPDRWHDRRHRADSYPLASAAGVLIVAYFGLAYQYFSLQFGQRGKTYFGLFLFLTWILPLVLGTIFAMSSNQVDGGIAGQMMFCLSPIPGLGMVSTSGQGSSLHTAIRAMLITPALLFAFVFNTLLVGARRRAHHAFIESSRASEDQIGGRASTVKFVDDNAPKPSFVEAEIST